MWYVSWHPLLHKDMPGRHIISRICFSSPPLCLCIVVIKQQEKVAGDVERCFAIRTSASSARSLARSLNGDVFHVVSGEEKKFALCLHFVFASSCVRGRKEQVGGALWTGQSDLSDAPRQPLPLHYCLMCNESSIQPESLSKQFIYGETSGLFFLSSTSSFCPPPYPLSSHLLLLFFFFF